MKPRADYSREAGGAALGARLRRLSERIDRDIARVYAARGIAFEQRWYGLLNQLVLNGPMSVGDIAAALRISHVSVSQSARSLMGADLLTALPDPHDARRRQLVLTAKGERLAADLAPLWRAFDEAAVELNAQAGDVAQGLGRLEDALEKGSLFDRITARLGG